LGASNGAVWIQLAPADMPLQHKAAAAVGHRCRRVFPPLRILRDLPQTSEVSNHPPQGVAPRTRRGGSQSRPYPTHSPERLDAAGAETFSARCAFSVDTRFHLWYSPARGCRAAPLRRLLFARAGLAPPTSVVHCWGSRGAGRGLARASRAPNHYQAQVNHAEVLAVAAHEVIDTAVPCLQRWKCSSSVACAARTMTKTNVRRARQSEKGPRDRLSEHCPRIGRR